MLFRVTDNVFLFVNELVNILRIAKLLFLINPYQWIELHTQELFGV